MSVGETTLEAPASGTWMPRRLLADARLSRLAVRGDRRAFEVIFERYHQQLYRYCRAILRDPDDAQDALQSTMASALHALPGEERRVALRPWLYRVAHNEAISILRRRPEASDPDPGSIAITPGADSEAEARERLRILVADLDALPERQRGALVMRELSGLDYGEIAAALSVSPSAARQAVYEARMALREVEGGREMDCEAARQVISERDGRSLRGRKLRAHLRGCESCSDFKAAISQRSSDLQALCPPLPALIGSSLVTAVLGGGGKGGLGAAAGGAAGGGGGLASGVTGGMAAKGASVVAAIAIGAGAAGLSGAVRIPTLDRGNAGVEANAGPGAGHANPGHAGMTGFAARSPSGRAIPEHRTGAGRPGADRSGGSGSRSDRAGANGASAAVSGNASSAGEAANGAPGNSASAPGHAGSSPGNSAAAPGHAGSGPGNGASAPGHTGSSPGNSESAPGHGGASSGNSASAPGRTGSTPGNSASALGHSASGSGNSANAPGHSASSAGTRANASRHPGK